MQNPPTGGRRDSGKAAPYLGGMNPTEMLCAVVAATQTDPQFSGSAERSFPERLLQLCAESPAALRRLIELKPITAANEIWYLLLLERVLPKWPADVIERPFLDWLEAHTASRSIFAFLEFRRVCVRRPTCPQLFSPSQQQAWEYLHRTADIFFDGAWHRQRITPSFNVLLAAPSGAGKSFLVNTFAATRDLPLMRLAYSQWVPGGARKQPDTITQLRDFVLKHERSCLFLDELDKAGPGETVSEWGAGVAGEVYATLDRVLFESASAEKPDVRSGLNFRLRRTVFIIAAGTWQSVFRHAGRQVGFGEKPRFEAGPAIAAAQRIPEELLRRFGGQPLVLEPPGATELHQICREEGLDIAASQVGLNLDYQAAAESGAGMRWLADARLQIELRRHEQAMAAWRAPQPIRYLDPMEVKHE